MVKMKHSYGSRRRPRSLSMDSVKLFAGSCLFVFVMGNLIMLQTYHSFVAPKPEGIAGKGGVDLDAGSPFFRSERDSSRRERRDIFREFADEFLPKIVNIGQGDIGENQYSVIEGRVRRLMQDGGKDLFGKLLQKSRLKESERNLVFRNSASKLPVDIKDLPSQGYPHRDHLLDCSDIEKIQNMRYIGGGWTKAVYQGEFQGHGVAVKTVDINGHDVNRCLGDARNMSYCYHRAARKIIKEIVLLQALVDENVIKVLGFCVPTKPFDGDVDSTVAMVTELGEPIDQIKLLQMSWEDRLKVSYDIVKLIEYLARTPYGSLVLNDFRRTQFVLVNGTLKLSDVDDAGFGEPTCTRDADCSFRSSDVNTTKHLGCSKGFCKNHNEFHNILKTGHHFTSFLLPHGAPKMLRPLIDKIIDNFEKLTVSSKGLLQEMSRVVELYKAGAYLDRGPQGSDYSAHYLQDLPGQFDYRCRFSMSGGACTLSVFDLREAQDICDMDEECQGFIWTRKKTWTGRTLVHLKNGKGTPSANSETDLYVKPS
ncbi:extracellular tyrosine-protein kinase PKDCC [Aplysia californica]|uniref:Extracellular tyrosine-protein kinase PKDCC n=1 Tax=Aplysia californica TaxID=6500 RepID=A0ABM0JCW0_APLCA|nr:extracellular tyrosine-protein kinase PKDCC [Aplysia californica]